jgi:predicted transcriptional regulator
MDLGARTDERHNAKVPKRLSLAVSTPASVYAATQTFGSELRVQLIHFFAARAGRQVDAAQALGVERAVVSLNIRALLATGVLVQEPDRTYSVDRDRLRALIHALEVFVAATGS